MGVLFDDTLSMQSAVDELVTGANWKTDDCNEETLTFEHTTTTMQISDVQPSNTSGNTEDIRADPLPSLIEAQALSESERRQSELYVTAPRAPSTGTLRSPGTEQRPKEEDCGHEEDENEFENLVSLGGGLTVADTSLLGKECDRKMIRSNDPLLNTNSDHLSEGAAETIESNVEQTNKKRRRRRKKKTQDNHDNTLPGPCAVPAEINWLQVHMSLKISSTID